MEREPISEEKARQILAGEVSRVEVPSTPVPIRVPLYLLMELIAVVRRAGGENPPVLPEKATF